MSYDLLAHCDSEIHLDYLRVQLRHRQNDLDSIIRLAVRTQRLELRLNLIHLLQLLELKLALEVMGLGRHGYGIRYSSHYFLLRTSCCRKCLLSKISLLANTLLAPELLFLMVSQGQYDAECFTSEMSLRPSLATIDSD